MQHTHPTRPHGLLLTHPPTRVTPAAHRVLGQHGAHAGKLAHVPQEPQEAHAAKPVQVVEDLDGRRPGGSVAAQDVIQDLADGCRAGDGVGVEGSGRGGRMVRRGKVWFAARAV
jgi:hypothetical protein